MDEPKRWKANFRCALNSLSDVREVKQLTQTRGKEPFKVYEFIDASDAPRSARSTKSTPVSTTVYDIFRRLQFFLGAGNPQSEYAFVVVIDAA